MKLWSLLLSIALACLIGVAQAADTYSRSEAERYITDAEAAWAESVATNDASVLQRIMADDCVWGVGRRDMGQGSRGIGCKKRTGRFSVGPS